MLVTVEFNDCVFSGNAEVEWQMILKFARVYFKLLDNVRIMCAKEIK